MATIRTILRALGVVTLSSDDFAHLESLARTADSAASSR